MQSNEMIKDMKSCTLNCVMCMMATWVGLGMMNYKIIMCLCSCVKTNPTMENLVCELVLKTCINEMCLWKPVILVGLVLLVVEGHIKKLLNKGAYHMSRARFMVLSRHIENVFKYEIQPHVWGLNEYFGSVIRNGDLIIKLRYQP